MSIRQLLPAWWIVYWGLITSLSVNVVLPAFDHHASEYSPFHGHVVLGSASPTERDQLLTAHAHAAAQPHSHGSTASNQEPGVVAQDEAARAVIGTSLLTDLLALAASVVHVIVATHRPLPQAVLAIWLTLAAAALLLRMRAIPPPEQPPCYH